MFLIDPSQKSRLRDFESTIPPFSRKEGKDIRRGQASWDHIEGKGGPWGHAKGTKGLSLLHAVNNHCGDEVVEGRTSVASSPRGGVGRKVITKKEAKGFRTLSKFKRVGG